MDAYKLHNIALEYAEKVWDERSDYVSTYYATISVLISDGGHIYTGITGLTVNYGDIEILRSERGATAAMVLDGQTYAKQIVTLSFKTRKFADPNEDALKALYELDHRNALCEIMTGDNTFTTIGDILGVEYDPAEEEAEEEAAAPVEETEELPAEPVEEEAPAEEEVEEETEAEEEAEYEEAEDDSEEEDSEEEYESDEDEDEEEEDSEEEYESDEEESDEDEEYEEEDSEDEEYEEDDEDEEYEDDDEDEDEDEETDAQPDFLLGFDFGDDIGPSSEIVVPKIQKSYEEYDKKNEEKRTETFSDGVEIDEDNPFFDAGSSEQKEVVAFADMETVKQEIEEGPKQPTMTKKEMLKLAKKRKKIAKNNNRYK